MIHPTPGIIALASAYAFIAIIIGCYEALQVYSIGGFWRFVLAFTVGIVLGLVWPITVAIMIGVMLHSFTQKRPE